MTIVDWQDYDPRNSRFRETQANDPHAPFATAYRLTGHDGRELIGPVFGSGGVIACSADPDRVLARIHHLAHAQGYVYVLPEYCAARNGPWVKVPVGDLAAVSVRGRRVYVQAERDRDTLLNFQTINRRTA